MSTTIKEGMKITTQSNDIETVKNNSDIAEIDLNTSAQITFQTGDIVMYSSHGVGRVLECNKDLMYGEEIELISVMFDDINLDLKITLDNAIEKGLRHLSSEKTIKAGLGVLNSDSNSFMRHGNNLLWNKRIVEYENKFKKGLFVDWCVIAKELHCNENITCSEKLIYNTTIKRITHETSLVLKKPLDEVAATVLSLLKDKETSGTQ